MSDEVPVNTILLARIEMALRSFGSPREVLALLPLILGKYVALQNPTETWEESWKNVEPHFRELFKAGHEGARRFFSS